MGIVNESFMLKNTTAQALYDKVKDLPIIDYHCHLSPQQIARDHRFADAYELFLGGDHYKWRQMRSCGIEENAITGNADPYEKWLGFARIMPLLIGNPLYHWTALELKRYFDIDLPLNEQNARPIWDRVNERLSQPGYSARGLIRRSNVEVVCTTDDPADDLRYHRQLKEEGFATRVLPTFRPDKIVNLEKDEFLPYLQAQGLETLEQIQAWLCQRIAFFHENGCRVSDHALEYVGFALGDAQAALEKRLAGQSLTAQEIDCYKTAVMTVCAREYERRGWAMQLHIGALRNNNSRMFSALGPDTGFDSINDLCIAQGLSAFLDHLDAQDQLPKTILYTLNPKDNYVLGTMLGNFQRGPVQGKLQFGSGWWFNDNRDGMEAQLKALANLGALGTFVGMLTDSRSFVSYPRHEYFRRILCNLLGQWAQEGEYPMDMETLTHLARRISYENAKSYFQF